MKNREQLVELIKSMIDYEAGGFEVFRGIGVYTISEEHLDNAANDIVDEIYDILDEFVEYIRFRVFGKYIELQNENMDDFTVGICQELLELDQRQLYEYLKDYLKNGSDENEDKNTK